MTARAVRPALGVVSDRHRLCAAAGLPLVEAAVALEQQVDGAADAGLDFFQLREPDLDTRALLALVRRLRTRAEGRVRVFVNDRADVAASAGAGLHLRAASMPAMRLRAWLPRDVPISRAVHSIEEAQDPGPVDFLVAGTFGCSPSKGPGAPLLGTEGLAAIVAAAPVPVYAIGGVTPAHWAAISHAGAVGCAAIGAFLPRGSEAIDAAVRRAARAFRGTGA